MVLVLPARPQMFNSSMSDGEFMMQTVARTVVAMLMLSALATPAMSQSQNGDTAYEKEELQLRRMGEGTLLRGGYCTQCG